MNTVMWLVRREIWEHRGSVWRTPLIIMAVFVALTALAIPVGQYRLGQMQGHAPDVMQALHGVWWGILALPALFMTVSMFFYAVTAISDERRDRSVLFWKSLPVSDGQVVLAKALIPLVVAPVAAVGLGIVGGVAMATLFLLPGVGLPTGFLNVDHVGQALAQVGLMGLIYVLSALPTVGWLLACSAWARSKPLLWAFLVPLMGWVAWLWLTGMGLSLPDIQSTLRHLLGGFWEVGRVHSLTSAQQMLCSAQLWWGVAMGLMGLGAAVVGRRRHFDA